MLYALKSQCWRDHSSMDSQSQKKVAFSWDLRGQCEATLQKGDSNSGLQELTWLDQREGFVFGNNERQDGKGRAHLISAKLWHFICHRFNTNECSWAWRLDDQSHVSRLTWLPCMGSMEKAGPEAEGAPVVPTGTSDESWTGGWSWEWEEGMILERA